MSLLLSPVATKEDFTTSSSYGTCKRKHHRNILKSKENTYKHRCSRALKNKLKKYKLRHDGSEDQNVLDISQTLIKSLNIKSPQSENTSSNNNSIFDEYYPRNYLFKMGRKKEIIKCNENSNLNSQLKNQQIHKDVNSSPLNGSKEKQQTNAFKLLMDSRNKSIGSNSPGKEKTVDENECQEIIEKKNIKAKRNLALQKMAEGKGSLKKKEIEEYQEYCINKKMEKRAERLKAMITSHPSTKTKKKTHYASKSKSSNEPNLFVNEEESKQKTLTLISLFGDSVVENNISPDKKISKEDNDFLKKLSPSLKKKENMLCYFKKVEKENPLSTNIENEDSNINDDPVIKVKLSSKMKKKGKKKKISGTNLNSEGIKSESISINCDIEIRSDTANVTQEGDLNISKDRRKRKRNDNVGCDSLRNNDVKDLPATESRPKRHIKKPVKYNEDIEVFSSDDELHIFTPKKKRQNDKRTFVKCDLKMEGTNNVDSTLVLNKKNNKAHISLKSKSIIKVDKKPDKTRENVNEVQKKSVKMAPIFACKPQLDLAAIEAKQKFLHSGVPDKLKKLNIDKKSKSLNMCIFPTTVHIQQSSNSRFEIPTSFPWSAPMKDMSDNDVCVSLEDNLFRNILAPSLDKREIENDMTVSCDKHAILQKIKKMYPKFPVFRTYRLLKEKKNGELKDCSYQDFDNSIEVIYGINDYINESPDKLSWTDKYKATSSKHIIGNFESIRDLKKWLITWTENEVKLRNRLNVESDSSDFYHSDTDSKDSFKATNNLLLITGPVGSGKTSGVYAVASELAIKVIEVNASSKRTGKIMLQDLQEATQSHKVNRGKSSAENSQKSQELSDNDKKCVIKRGRPKKHKEISSAKKLCDTKNEKKLSQSQPMNSQESTRTEMSLILIDDADIVFEQDDGFCSAIVQLVQSSKRPVILISSSDSCAHLQRFTQTAKIINMRPFQPRMLGTWLDIMCLADGGVSVPGTGAMVLDFFKGDIRKAINSLQFYVSSQIKSETEKESNTQNSDTIANMDDESSSMSWADHYNYDDKVPTVNSSNNKISKSIIGQQLTLSPFSFPINLFNMWWSIPQLLITPFSSKLANKLNIDEDSVTNKHMAAEMESIANAYESVSISEFIIPTKPATAIELSCHPWLSVESNSVSENENLFDYNSNEETIEEISHHLVSRSILEAQNVLKIENSTNIQCPSMAVRREREKVISRHHNLSSSLNPSAVLDRRALALDYWSYCRTICRSEKSKTDNNLKRNNRFCHYLKSLNVMCKSDYFDRLADSLHPTTGPKDDPSE